MTTYFLNDDGRLVERNMTQQPRMGQIVLRDPKGHFKNWVYGPKNWRIVEAILRGEPYVVLFDNHNRDARAFLYALVVVKSERMPLRTILETFGYDLQKIDFSKESITSLLGFNEPAGVFDTKEFREEKAADSLLREIVSAMMESISDDPNKMGYWYLSENTGVITTRFSRNQNLSANGGDYYVYREFEVRENGITATSTWSCNLQEYNSPNIVHY